MSREQKLWNKWLADNDELRIAIDRYQNAKGNLDYQSARSIASSREWLDCLAKGMAMARKAYKKKAKK